MSYFQKIAHLLSVAILFVPALAYAAPQNFAQLVGMFTGWIDRGVIPVLIAAAFIVFLYGVLNYYIFAGDNYSKLQVARNVLLYGLIGLVVMLSFWGLVKLVNNTFFGTGGGGRVPSINNFQIQKP